MIFSWAYLCYYLYLFNFITFVSYHLQIHNFPLCVIIFHCILIWLLVASSWYRTHRTPVGTVDLLSLSIIIMHVQTTLDKRCQPQNLNLILMLQLWVGQIPKMQNPLLPLRLAYIYFCYGFLSHFFCFYLFIVLGIQRHSLHPVLCPLSAQNYITIPYYSSDVLDVVLLDAFVRRSSHIGA